MERTEAVEHPSLDAETPDFDRYASYEDGDHVVVCDRKEPTAWLRSTVAVDLRP